MITTVKVCGKTSDLCHVCLVDEAGKVVSERDGYVPDYFPGQHYGDYLILDIDVETGVIKNWKKPSQKKLLADMA